MQILKFFFIIVVFSHIKTIENKQLLPLGGTPSIDLSGYLGLEESSGVKTKLRLEDLQWGLADVWCPFGAAPHGQAVLAHCGPFGSHGDIGQQCEAITGDGSGLTSLPGKVECLLPSALPVVIFTSAQLISGCPQLWALGYNSCQPFVDGSELHFIAKAQKSGVKGLTVTIRRSSSNYYQKGGICPPPG